MKTAYMATFPKRIDCLRKSVESLAPQVDKLKVWCNGFGKAEFQRIKSLIDIANVEFYPATQNIGALGKIAFADEWSGYIFLVDDDFVYPKDYVSQLTAKIDEYGRQAAISYHGQVNNFPSSSYFNDIVVRYAVVRNLKQDEQVHIIGSGVCGFHSDVFNGNPINTNEFRYTNMLDVSLSIALARRGIRRIVAAHKAYWIDPCRETTNSEDSIFVANRKDDTIQTSKINAATSILTR
jgi:hypothetical protein